MAALCLNTLTDCMRVGDIGRLEQLIPQTLLGTSVARAVKNDPETEGMLSFAQGETVTIQAFLDALGEFAASTGGKGDYFRRVYSLLCEFAHPNLGGTAEFRHVLQEDDSGWIVQYSQTSSRVREQVEMALDVLLASMKVGYATSKMLRLTSFEVEQDRMLYRGPSESEVKRIWDTIIHVESA
jgi:hypothetical protein